MTTSLAHLPPAKQQWLLAIRDTILDYREKFDIELIVLYGSYATGKWVEEHKRDKSGRIHEYVSDVDLLVVPRRGKKVRRLEGFLQDTLNNKFGQTLENLPELSPEEEEQQQAAMLGGTYTLPPWDPTINVIVHDVDFLNEHLRDSYFFFTDIYREGVLLYDSGKVVLEEPPEELSFDKQHDKAKAYLEEWLATGDEFAIDFRSALKRNSLFNAAFYLHQATERYLHTVLLVFTDSKPPLHDLAKLHPRCAKACKPLRDAFPRQTEEDKRLFDLLKRAYIDARYKPHQYVITAADLAELGRRVQRLREVIAEQCTAHVAQLAAKTES